MTTWRVSGVRLPDGEPVDAGIDHAGRWTSTPAGDAEPLPGRFILAGLVDAHCHLSIAMNPGHLPAALPVEAARANLAAARAAGVTVVRDVGSPASVTLGLLADPDDGLLLVAGRFLAPPGQYFPALHTPVDAADLVDAALAEVAAGARWVKLVGDFPVLAADGSRTAPTRPTYPLADVRRLVRAVHAAGARVAAHTTTRWVTELVDAGVDSVEHGTNLTVEDLAALGARGGAWTPTLCASGRDEEILERMRHLLPRALDLGVTVLAGTDIVGTVPREVALLVACGLTPTQALAAASTQAATFLEIKDLPGVRNRATVVTYDADPRDDPAVLATPAAVVLGTRRLR